MALLTACGGSELPASDSRADATTAAYIQADGGPAPDCAAEGCKAPRIVDGLAEEFRASAQQRQALEDKITAVEQNGSIVAAASTETDSSVQ